MENEAQPQPASPGLAKALAAINVLICTAITVFIWVELSPLQGMWPLPGFYLVEMLLLSTAAAYAVFREAGHGGAVIWGVFGAVSAFALLAAWTVGLLYLPVIVLLAVTGILFLRRRRQRFRGPLAIAALAAFGQGALILVAIQMR
jgi:hypothetical protein